MPSEAARIKEGLETQTQKVMQVFIDAGYEIAAPEIIQTADVFLDVIGEDLRAQTYVFTDPEGEELCLRPDLTVPTCKYYLEKHKDDLSLDRLSYLGPAFRYQPIGISSVHPREFHQMGIETIGPQDKEQEDGKTVGLIFKAIKNAGVKNIKIKIGDLGIFRAFLKTLEMSERWRLSLLRSLGSSLSFDSELEKLSQKSSKILKGIAKELQATLDPNNLSRSEEAVLEYLSARGLEPNGTRTVREIAQNLMWHLSDTKASPLSPENLNLIKEYLSISGPVEVVSQRLRTLFQTSRNADISILESHEKRLGFMSENGVDITNVEFSAGFGGRLAYYTGFIFEILSPEREQSYPLAGGGRYDELMKSIGATMDIPAVGGAIHTERLLSEIGRTIL